MIVDASYKRGIIDVVGSDFEAERDEILSRLTEALKRYEGTVYFKVDANRFNRIKDDSANLFFVEGPGPSQTHQIFATSNSVSNTLLRPALATGGFNGMSNRTVTEMVGSMAPQSSVGGGYTSLANQMNHMNGGVSSPDRRGNSCCSNWCGESRPKSPQYGGFGGAGAYNPMTLAGLQGGINPNHTLAYQ